MPKIVQYSLILFIIVLTIKIIIDNICIKIKSDKFLNKYFKDEEKLYSLEEVSSAFRLEKEHFLQLLSTLEKYNYFSFFNKKGVTMVKDYYSRYELKYLVRILSKKQKLKY
ncbi:hypothetical protein OFR22_06000 [Brachyspira hyodysenteriae]|uniref:Uncharacterized protein n=2 Tax=Brachyspira hyodysenteriae TaxID=159 RepID=A0A3B6VFZ1_BRAHW|nr:hypothetical protein [Brachyspira hyodysenteriae]ACN83874.1 hypothetical protein BHWA1_01398 [Brachyspira hyodysenteriae WA1]ANN64011.1 hypothetical protein BHYOB78_09075 [Brachyspira hyodysenteriae ATCC 27164]AUJ49601.1 hypothetical protein BH718_01157 [Brachyspira hyodysenteriae]KLI14296.1 hypothetical protein SU46_11370 [Brachyspira hyodysenteriae]KLI17183.1 hypothetical protein SU44_04215 [Brachyspira hyodysenteriae]